MKKLINRRYFFFFSTITMIFLAWYCFNCPFYLDEIEGRFYSGHLDWASHVRNYRVNGTIIHYSGFWGEADFGFTVITELFNASVNNFNLYIEAVKISEKSYNPLIKGFTITIERITPLTSNAWVQHFDVRRIFTDNLTYLCSYNEIHFPSTNPPEKLYIKIDFTVHIIFHPYFEIQTGNTRFDFTSIGFHLKVYSGSIILSVMPK